MSKKVSIIMSTYNTDKEYLKESINSILNQSYKNLEFIIINDGGDDYKYIEDNFNDDRIKIIKNEKTMGLPFSLNKAIEISTGDYIARMDSDDISLKNRIKKQVKFMEKNKDTGICSTFFKRIGNQNNFVTYPFYNKGYVNSLLFFGNALCHPSVMFRKEYLINNKIKYNEDYIYTQDYELWCRCKDANIAIIPKVLLFYRVHNKQISNSKKEKQKFFYESILKRNLKELDLNEKDINLLKILHGNDKNIDFQELYDFIENALKQNDKKKLYNTYKFKKILYNRFYVLYLKHKKNKFKDLFKYKKMFFRWYNISYLYKQIIIHFKLKIEMLVIKQL